MSDPDIDVPSLRVIRRLTTTLDFELDRTNHEFTTPKEAIEAVVDMYINEGGVQVNVIDAYWDEDDPAEGRKDDGRTRAERTIGALIELADALDAMPVMLRPATILGEIYNTTRLRQAAAGIANVMDAAKEAMS